MVVRFNPDGYVAADGGQVKSSFKYTNTTGLPVIRSSTEWKGRCDKLIATMNHHVAMGVMDGPPGRELTVESLFFDGR